MLSPPRGVCGLKCMGAERMKQMTDAITLFNLVFEKEMETQVNEHRTEQEILFLCHSVHPRIRIVGGLHHCRWVLYRAKPRRYGIDRHHIGLSDLRAGGGDRYGAWPVGRHSIYDPERAGGNPKASGVLCGYGAADAGCRRFADGDPVCFCRANSVFAGRKRQYALRMPASLRWALFFSFWQPASSHLSATWAARPLP